jgi:hypothetical protein
MLSKLALACISAEWAPTVPSVGICKLYNEYPSKLQTLPISGTVGEGRIIVRGECHEHKAPTHQSRQSFAIIASQTTKPDAVHDS